MIVRASGEVSNSSSNLPSISTIPPILNLPSMTMWKPSAMVTSPSTNLPAPSTTSLRGFVVGAGRSPSVRNVVSSTSAPVVLISTSTSPWISTPGIEPPASRCSAARPTIDGNGSKRNWMSIEPDAEPTNAISVLTAPAMRIAAPSSLPDAVKEIRPENVMTSLIVRLPSISAWR